MLKILKFLTIILLLQGCKTVEYIYLEPKPYEFQKVEQPKVREIRVYKDDIDIQNLYILNFRDAIDFLNSQIDDYNNNFLKEELSNEN